MARLNIEDSIFKDNRFIKLMVKRGGCESALGALVRAWIIAQKFYLTESKMIPWAEWESQDLSSDLIDVGLAVREGDFVRMKGADEQFSWLAQRVEAGRRGGLARARNQSEQKLEEEGQAVAKRSPSKSKQTQASYSFSYSKTKVTKTKDLQETTSLGDSGPLPDSPPTVAVKNLETQKPPARGKRSPEQSAKISRFVAAYVTAYQSRFGEGARPEDLSDPKVRGQIAGFAADHPDVERACELVQVYFQTQNPWFEKRGWDFLTFRSNLALLGQALDSGQQPGGINWTKLAGEIKAEEERRFGSRGNT